jgi:hypothetical protein
MCGGGNSNPEPPPQQPLPAPTPMPMPSDVSPQQTATQRRSQISALKYGAVSTLKTPGGAQGVTGSGADLSNSNVSGQKKTLGS